MFFSKIFSDFYWWQVHVGMALLFQLCHRMHITVIVLNFTRERVPSEERERGLKCIFKIFQGYIIQLICD